jgi:DNA-binding NarL/FixJ family response regulator
MSPNHKSSNVKTRVFIVEDHPVFRDGLVQLLKAEKDLEVCGWAGDFETALESIGQLNPDIALVDLELPGKSGLDLIKKIHSLKLPIKLLVVSMYDEALYADRVLRAGGHGYIMKEEGTDEIIIAIRDVLDGHIYVSEEVMASKLKNPSEVVSKPKTSLLDELSDQELRILEMLGQGKNNEEIARELALETQDVTAHCEQMQKILKLKTSNALIRYAVCWVETGAAL